jgi:hypothetical protein
MDGDAPRSSHSPEHPDLLALELHDGSSGLEIVVIEWSYSLSVMVILARSRPIEGSRHRPTYIFQDMSFRNSLCSWLDLAMRLIKAT